MWQGSWKGEEGNYISSQVEEDVSNNELEGKFAQEWVAKYPNIPLISQAVFWRGKKPGAKRQSSYRADFAYVKEVIWTVKKGRSYMYQVLPPGVLIELDGGVHGTIYKWKSDGERERLAADMGFSLFRLRENTYNSEFKLEEIVKVISSLQ